MGGRGASSTRSTGSSITAIASKLGFEFNPLDSDKLSDSTKTLIVESISDMVKEFPSLQGSVTRIDYVQHAREDTLAGIRSIPGKHYLEITPKFNNSATLREITSRGAADGYHPDANPKSIIYHEMGHVLERQVFEKEFKSRLKNGERDFAQGKIANRIINKAAKSLEMKAAYKKNGLTYDAIGAISGYAKTHGTEAFAEAVSDYMAHGSKSAPLSQAIWKYLKTTL